MKKVDKVIEYVVNNSKRVESRTWQGKDLNGGMMEVLHFNEEFILGDTEDIAARFFKPKLPWADIHFAERVSGKPLNPPPSHILWAPGTKEFLEAGKKFSHSYPERFWSRSLHRGIRYDIADLNTLVRVLRNNPKTRQAYLPMFFPEDLTAAEMGDRVPCSLGWQFIVRDGIMDCFYPIRSCDIFRHLRNDLYLANLLVLWVLEKSGIQAIPGRLIFHATSLHCFVADVPLYEKGLIK